MLLFSKYRLLLRIKQHEQLNNMSYHPFSPIYLVLGIMYITKISFYK